MVSIARKNLFHNPVRLIITLMGLTASLFLILSAMGMFIGILDDSGTIMNHTDADMLVLQKDKHILSPSIFKDGTLAKKKSPSEV